MQLWKGDAAGWLPEDEELQPSSSAGDAGGLWEGSMVVQGLEGPVEVDVPGHRLFVPSDIGFGFPSRQRLAV